MTKKEFIIIITLFILSFFLYVFKLNSISSGFHGDEAELSLYSLKIVNKEITTLIGVGQHNHPIISFLPQALSFILFGKSIFAARLPSAILSSFSVLIFYLFVRYLFTFRIALISSILFLFSHLWIAMSRLAINNTQIVLFELLTFYFLFLALNKKSFLYFFITGIGSGMMFYLYAGYRIVPLIVVTTILYNIIFDKNKKKYFLRFLIFILGFILISIPQINFFYNNPSAFFAREDDIYIFSNSGEATQWRKDNYPNKNILEIFLNQSLETFMISSDAHDTSGQYGYPNKLFDPITFILIIFGLLFSARYIKKTKYFFLLSWFFLTLIIGNILTIDPFFLPRATGALPVIFIFSGLSLDNAIEISENNFKKLKKIILFIICLFIVLIIIKNLKIYFIDSEQKMFGDSNKYPATKISNFLKTIDKSYTVIFLSSPNLHADFSTIRFIAPYNKQRYIDIELPESYIAQKTNKTIYIFYPQYQNKLEEIKKLNPEGTIVMEKNKKGEIQYFIYKIY